jgi:prevent-host-death family protein
MTSIDVDAAKSQLAELLERVARGEEVVIARAGKPLARLVPLESRRPGSARGLGRVGEDFDAPMPEAFLSDFRCRP